MTETNEQPKGESSSEENAPVAELDERIAPSSVRDDEGADVPEAPVEEEVAPEAVSRRPRTKTLVAGIAACAVAICVLTAGVGYAAGWFGGGDVSGKPAALVTSQTAPNETKPAAGDESGQQKEPEAGQSAPDGASPTESPIVEAPPEATSEVAEASAMPPAQDATTSVAPSEPTPPAALEPAPAPEPVAPSSVTVSVYVDSSRAASKGWPASMASTSVTLNQGATVYDALCASGVSVGGSSTYVSSINGLAEFSCGSSSGWLYFVNGSSPSGGCGSYVLRGGESITWVYTLEMGNDL